MPGGWLEVAKVGDVVEGEPFACEVAGKKIALYLLDGAIFATTNICTHAYALLSDGLIEGEAIECPLHNARFDIRTGKALSSPAEDDLETFPARIDGDVISVCVST